MAVGTTAAIMGGVSAAGGIAKAISGGKMARRAKEAIANYERQELTNQYKDLQVSTLGADLRREEAARNTSTVTDALRTGGTRALIGGLGRVQAQNNLLNREIAVDLDEQQKEIDRMTARDGVRVQQMQERREEADLAGLGQAYNTGRQDLWNGIGDVSSALMFTANNFSGGNATKTNV